MNTVYRASTLKRVRRTVEAEAMPAHILRELLRTHIEVPLPERALEIAKVAEQSEREHLKRTADLMEEAE